MMGFLMDFDICQSNSLVKDVNRWVTYKDDLIIVFV